MISKKSNDLQFKTEGVIDEVLEELDGLPFLARPRPWSSSARVAQPTKHIRGYQNFTCKAEGQRGARHPVIKHPLCSRDRHGVISLQLAGVHVQRLTKVHLVFSASERV